VYFYIFFGLPIVWVVGVKVSSIRFHCPKVATKLAFPLVDLSLLRTIFVIHITSNSVVLILPPTVGLCDVGGFEKRPPGTAAQLINKCTNKVQKMIEKLLPEPQPNSEPMLMGIASAPILQNPLLCAVICPKA
jgi:hypothetical protein